MAGRCYAVRQWRMTRAAAYCVDCGHGYQLDTISDEQGPRSQVRSACDCTPAGRRALRDLVSWPQEPIDTLGAARTTATAPATPAPTMATGIPTCSQKGSEP